MPTGNSGLFKNTKGANDNPFWDDIPIGKEYAVTYFELCQKWNCSERAVRNILHDLSLYDNGDNYILIRSGRSKGFYKTDDESEIKAYKRESKGLKQSQVCDIMKRFDHAFDKSLLSKMENGVCLPTFYQLSKLAEIYAVEAVGTF